MVLQANVQVVLGFVAESGQRKSTRVRHDTAEPDAGSLNSTKILVVWDPVRTWVQGSTEALSKTLHRLWLKLPTTFSQCFCFPISLALQVQLQTWRRIWTHETSQLLTPACCKDEPLCPVTLRGLWLRFMVCSGLHMTYKVVQLHSLAGFSRGLMDLGSRSQGGTQLATQSSHPLRSSSLCLQWNSPCLWVLMHLYRKAQGSDL